MLLSLVEEKLCVDCAVRRIHHPAFYRVGFQANGRRNLVTARNFPGWIDEDGTISAALHEDLWGDWVGRELEFFEACAGDVEGCSWEDVLRRVGPDAAVQALRLKALVEREPPKNLRPAKAGLEVEFEEVEGGVAYSSAQGSFDVQVVSLDLWHALQNGEGEKQTHLGCFLPIVV